MYGVVLAAGRGTRMRPLTDRRPKPLLPVGDRSLLERVFDTAADVVGEFVVVTGYRGEAIREAIGESYRGRPVHYVEQAEALGTAHAVAQAEPVVDDDFLVLNGDVVVDASLPRALAEAEGTVVAATEVADPRAYGVLSTAEDGSLAAIVEKPEDPPTNLANVGCYAFEPEVFEYIDRTPESERGEYEITTTIDLLLDDGHRIEVAHYEGTWLDVGRPWELLEANELALAELDESAESVESPAGTVEDGVHLHGPVVVEEGARVRSGAYVEGPAMICEGADVGPNAYVRGSTVIGPDAHVGHSVEVKNSVLMADASVGHLSYVGDSVLGRDVNFGAGTNVANLRHDGENVRLTVKGERVDTGRRKLGAIVGDGAKTGINTSLNAGVKLGAGETTGLDEAVTRDRISD